VNHSELSLMRGMVSVLNEASDAYYNGKTPIMTDEQFDMRLEDLRQFEEETGFVFSNSPTQNVGYKVLTELKEVEHNHPMLSLDKCHTIDEIVKFANNKYLVTSIKLDGLTISLLYEDGVLVRGETRGDGHVGSDVTEHVKQFLNVPLKIDKTGTYIVDGEAIITDEDFAEVNKNGEYKNSRNLASGTLSVLDTSLVAKRKLKFFAWDIIKGGCSDSLRNNLKEAKELGFDVVPNWLASTLDPKNLESNLDYVFDFAAEDGFPCDGIVFKFDDIEYGKSLGATSHHFKNGIAYKRKDAVYETELLDIEWTMGKTGVLTPTAVFKEVEIDGTMVSRASVHNVSILTDLALMKGDKIKVYKANMIIPQVKRNVSAEIRDNIGGITTIDLPTECPICKAKTEVKKDNNTEILVCTNPHCKGKLLGKLTHFVSKNAMNIDGMSEATLEFLIERGWVNSFKDIYKLDYYREPWKEYDGFGDKSVDKLLDAIEESKHTTLDRFIYSLSIPLIGRSASKTIAKYFDYDYKKFDDAWDSAYGFDWTQLDDFGSNTNTSMINYYLDNFKMVSELAEYLTFEKPKTTSNSNSLNGKTFCITGSLIYFSNRDEAKEKIESLGGKVVSGVTKKTNYLVCNEASNSSKYKKATELGITIISEVELAEMLK